MRAGPKRARAARTASAKRPARARAAPAGCCGTRTRRDRRAAARRRCLDLGHHRVELHRLEVARRQGERRCASASRAPQARPRPVTAVYERKRNTNGEDEVDGREGNVAAIIPSQDGVAGRPSQSLPPWACCARSDARVRASGPVMRAVDEQSLLRCSASLSSCWPREAVLPAETDDDLGPASTPVPSQRQTRRSSSNWASASRAATRQCARVGTSLHSGRRPATAQSRTRRRQARDALRTRERRHAAGEMPTIHTGPVASVRNGCSTSPSAASRCGRRIDVDRQLAADECHRDGQLAQVVEEASRTKSSRGRAAEAAPASARRDVGGRCGRLGCQSLSVVHRQDAAAPPVRPKTRTQARRPAHRAADHAEHRHARERQYAERQQGRCGGERHGNEHACRFRSSVPCRVAAPVEQQ